MESRKRFIHTKISEDDKLNKLIQIHGPDLGLFYTWLIPYAHEDAIVYGNSQIIKTSVFRLRNDLTVADVEYFLAVLHNAGFIYWDEEQVLFNPDKFYMYQNIPEEKRRKSTKKTRFKVPYPDRWELSPEIRRIVDRNDPKDREKFDAVWNHFPKGNEEQNRINASIIEDTINACPMVPKETLVTCIKAILRDYKNAKDKAKLWQKMVMKDNNNYQEEPVEFIDPVKAYKEGKKRSDAITNKMTKELETLL